MTPEEHDIAAAIAETPANAIYRGERFRVTAPQPRRIQTLDGADLVDDPTASVTALARDFKPHWTRPGKENVKTRIQIDGETWRITDAVLDSKKAGYVLTLQTPNK